MVPVAHPWFCLIHDWKSCAIISSFPCLTAVSYCVARAGSQGEEPLVRMLSLPSPCVSAIATSDVHTLLLQTWPILRKDVSVHPSASFHRLVLTVFRGTEMHHYRKGNKAQGLWKCTSSHIQQMRVNLEAPFLFSSRILATDGKYLPCP